MKIRNFINKFGLFFYIIFCLIFIFIIVETSVRFLPIYEKFGWKDKKPLFDRIELIKNSNQDMINNIVIGDSLVEYMNGNEENFVYLTSKKINLQNSNQKFFNLGFAGKSIRDYLMVLNYVVKNDVKADRVFIFIDNSTDFSDYFFDIEADKDYTKNWSLPIDYNIDKNNLNLKNFIKQSVFINILYRYVLKQYFRIDYSKSLNKSIKNLNSIFNLNDSQIKERTNLVDKNLLHLSRSDIINSFWTAAGIVFPKMKKYEKYGYPKHSTKINELLLKDLDAINNICKENNIECSVIFIPDQSSVSKDYQELYKNVGYEINDEFLNGINYYENLLIKSFKNKNINFYRLHGHLISDRNIYIYFDNHFNFHGNEILSELFYKILVNKNIEK